MWRGGNLRARPLGATVAGKIEVRKAWRDGGGGSARAPGAPASAVDEADVHRGSVLGLGPAAAGGGVADRLRQAVGGTPATFLKARLKAASESARIAAGL